MQLNIEKLSDKQFFNKFFDQISEPYDLTHKIENPDEDNGETDNEDDESFAGEEIDFSHTSGSDKEDEEMNEENEDFVDDKEMDTAKEESEKAQMRMMLIMMQDIIQCSSMRIYPTGRHFGSPRKHT
ncbi:hypothetical protein VP01_2913g2 [Puccinia sorghi]|uniref:Uncharacterized protein n=1 Tax=Puccinia sorghi TaxID=27349 RepID=A0A0L6V197_9BASI|nr:hypothetical protein VP01_2913g2 [Puccinia sorghi]